MCPPAQTKKPLSRTLPPSELMQALRGLWELDGEMVVVEVDQEKGVIIASTYEGEAVDPRPVIQKGIQVRMFEQHRNGA